MDEGTKSVTRFRLPEFLYKGLSWSPNPTTVTARHVHASDSLNPNAAMDNSTRHYFADLHRRNSLNRKA